MKTLKLLIFGILLAPALVFAGQDYFVSPSEPHGVVTGIIDQPAKELWAVNITDVNGVRTTREEGVWLKPGTYTISAKASGKSTTFARSVGRDLDGRVGGVDRRRTTAVGRDTRTRDRDDLSIELEVEEGKTYYIALDTTSHNRRDWKLVNWRVK